MCRCGKPTLFLLCAALFGTVQELPSPCISRAQFPDTLDTYLSQQDVLIYGGHRLDKTGWALTSGDVNGDGTSDLIIGSSGASPLGRQGVGEIEILWGGAVIDSIIDLAAVHPRVSRVFSEGPYVGLFMSLTAGDYNADGLSDIAFGLITKPPFVVFDGMAYIVFGRPDFPDTLDIRTTQSPVTRLYGVPRSNAWFGVASTTADVNRDGYDDFVVSAWGFVYVVQGRPSFPSEIHVARKPTGVTYVRGARREGFGLGLAAGDVDNDGCDDLLIGSPGNEIDTFEGHVTLVYGQPSLPDTIDMADPLARVVDIRPEPNPFHATQLGEPGCVAVADVHGDGYGDLILSTPYASVLGYEGCGTAYVIRGGPALPPVIPLGDPSPLVSRLLGRGNGREYGARVSSGDLTGDGLDDVVVLNAHSALAGRNELIVVPGRRDFPDTLFLATDRTVSRILGEPSTSGFGRALVVGDVNTDGGDDLAVGSYAADALTRYRAGRAYVFYGATPPLPVQVTVNPRTLNLTSQGRRVTVEIRLPDECPYTIADVDRSSILLNDAVPPDPEHIVTGDFDGDGRAALVLKFSRNALSSLLGGGDDWVRLTITGRIGVDRFEGTDSLRVIRNGPLAATAAPVPDRSLGAHPNPFNPHTTITFVVDRSTTVDLSVVSVDGRTVRSLLSRVLGRGDYAIGWDGTNDQGDLVSSGVYFARLRIGRRILTTKMILVR